ncbi:MAG: hypothetical protein NTU62_10105 [Spirochaetes bacterium]|nr:hypothetical protein [Spirochaetota bacterium]
MKKKLIFLALAVLAIGASWADGSSVTVQNQEEWRFWYVLDPPGFTDELPGSARLASKAAAYLATEGAEFPFTVLEPGETMAFSGLAEGTHFLLGFFEDDSLEELPVRMISLQADSSMAVRHYDVYSLPELMMAVRGEGMLAQFAPAEEAVAETTVDGPVEEEQAVEAVEEPVVEEVAEAVEVPSVEEQAVEAVEEPVVEEAVEAVEVPAVEEVAEAVVEPAAEEQVVEEQVVEEQAVEEAEKPLAAEQTTAVADEPVAEVAEEPVDSEVLATFTESYDPVYFTRESRDGFVVLPIASSRAWGKPGTRLSAFSGSLADGTFTLMLRSPDGFAQNVSCFFYVFPVRTAGGASEYTFEARPQADGRAAVVLWQKGRAVPRLVGTARTDDGEFTWTARADELPPELAQELGPATTLDLTTAWLDETSGTWEEFYFTTFAVADLTR